MAEPPSKATAPAPQKKQKKRKPTKLVKTSSTPATQKLTDANATQSPLLRLTAELRNRIYKEVFGGYFIHIERWPRAPSRKNVTLCRAEAPKPADKQIICRRPFAETHQDNERHQVSLDLRLLQTCRQIHREAALLPYIINTFAVVHEYDLSIFADRLIASQRPALRRIVLDLYTIPVCFRTGPNKSEKARLARLTGIQTVIVVLRFDDYESIQTDAVKLDRLQGAASQLAEALPWHSVTHVNIRVVQHFDRKNIVTDQSLIPAAYTTWARKAEKELLEAWSK